LGHFNYTHLNFTLFPYFRIFALAGFTQSTFFNKLDNKLLQCELCPRSCIIPPGKRGYCRVRQNRGGILYTLVYAKPVAINIDPIEKKPLFHFLPSTTVFSIATAGCNLKCKFCRNWEISQAKPEEYNIFTPNQKIL